MLPGVTLTVTGGFKVTVAEADFDVSAVLVAVTVTVCCVARLAGAVYKPDALTLPTPAGLMAQVTVVLANPVTVAVNCCVPPWPNVAVVGLIITGGLKVTVATEDFVLSATLVAVTVTVCCDATLAGAVYSPAALTLPLPAGLIDQLTLVFADPVTVALNCCVAPCPNVTVAGETLTVTGGGFNVTVAEADLLLSAALVAVIVTACCVAILDGAVYKPPELSVPTPAGVAVHVTVALVEPVTVALNC